MSTFQLVGIVAGCVLEQDGTYLLVQEKQQKVYGLWNLPAGRVDEGETIEAAAVRETREESGYDVVLEGKIGAEHSDAQRPVLHAFKGRIMGGDLKFDPDELLDARWFTLAEVREAHKQGKLRADWVLNAIEHVAAKQPLLPIQP